ncbi:hypothetical protein FC678_14105 [Peribacillus simplex]|uniref:GIY-YIG domain-containing protein n=1 Tax=Peribacillus simplex TaxID=1478 RepID=A0A9X9ESA0_9BACI|nr:GIY-YIG nuclease family protein [Peribacillus simplex]TKH10669.1 hypothetical protein FC678_14105 [Peribacillus simplex]
MARKTENPNWLTVTIFQKTNYIIGFTLKVKGLLGEDKITGIEHSDRFYGKERARTHNSLFDILKSILVAQGRWTDKETKIGRVRKDKPNELDADDKYGFIYMTTNTVNGMRYIGKHTGFGDNYLGSGTKFKMAVKEFGKDKFEREIIAFAYSKDHLNFLEKNYIDVFNATVDPMFYNTAPGGEGWYEEEEVCL